jgi:hypothetical protein
LSRYWSLPKDILLLDNFQSSEQHLDDCIAVASQFLPLYLHILLPDNKEALDFRQMQSSENRYLSLMCVKISREN